MSNKYELLEHTADTGILAHGRTMNEAFENAALGMFSIIASPANIGESETSVVSVESSDMESMLIDWLNELIFRFDTDNVVYAKFDIFEMGETRLKARVAGQKVDPAIHQLHTGIKAATWHNLKIEHNGEYTVQVYFDI